MDQGFTASGARRRPVRLARTEADAKRLLKEMDRAWNRQEEASTRTTVKAWAATWLAMTEKTARPTSHSADRIAVNRWIVPTIGHRRLGDLTPADVRAVADVVTVAGNSTSTARRYVTTLRIMLAAAVEEGHPVPARVLRVKKPARAVTDRQAIPTPVVLELLAASGELRPVGAGSRWMAAFLEGLRQAEALGLTWPEVGADTMAVSWQLKPLPYNVPRDRSSGFRIPDGYEARRLDGALHLVRPKSKAGWRVIPILPVMRTALDQWREHAPDSPHGLVWPRPDGRPQTADADADAWRALQKAAGVAHPAGRPYKGHEIRHTTATLLMELGVPESVRIAIMGHSSIATTHGYEHVDTTLAREALAKVAERLQLGG